MDGGVVQMGASNTLDPALFVKHQTISVEVTPSDSYDQGAAVASGEVEVHNSTPAMDRVTLDPSALTTATDVTCVPVGLADADADPLTVSTTW